MKVLKKKIVNTNMILMARGKAGMKAITALASVVVVLSASQFAYGQATSVADESVVNKVVTNSGSTDTAESSSKGYDTGWYAGLAVTSNKKMTAVLDAGYQVTQSFALEGSYGNLSSEVQDSIPMMGLRAVGNYRINQDFTLLGRAGLASLKATEKCFPVFANTCISNFNGAVYEKNYVGPTLGFGLAYEAFEDFGVRVSYDLYQFGEDKKNVGALGLAVVKRF